MKFIQGKPRNQWEMYCLDEHVDTDNEVRLIDLFVDSLNLAELGFKVDYEENGRPAYHPGALLRLFFTATGTAFVPADNLKRNANAIWNSCGSCVGLKGHFNSTPTLTTLYSVIYYHMKIGRLFCFLLFFLFKGVPVNSQITISSTHMPGSGDTLRYSLAEAASVNTAALNATGANQTWDFSQLNPQSQGLNEYKLALQINPAYSLFFGLTAYGLKTFDTLNLGTIQLTKGYDFLAKNNSVFKAVGRGLTYQNLPVPSFYTDDDEIYQFPLQFGDNDSSTFRVAFDLAGTLGLVQKGSRRNQVTGWGSITTPYGTFNALKVETTVWQTDSISIGGFGLPPIPSTRVWYSWWSTATEMPIFEARGNVLPFSTAPVFTEYRFRDQFRACLGYVVADFAANQTQGTTTDVFQLQDQSQCAPETYFWNVQPATYTWMNGSAASDPNPSIRFDAAGYYSLGLTVFKGFTLDSEQKTDYILIAQSSLESEGQPLPLLHPNPSTAGQPAVVRFPGTFRVKLFNGLGRELSCTDWQTETALLSGSGLAEGLYWVQVLKQDGSSTKLMPWMLLK